MSGKFRGPFLGRLNNKVFYLSALALMAVMASGLFLMSDGISVFAQKGDIASRGDSTEGRAEPSKEATKGMLTLALNFGAATEYSVFADRGISTGNSTILGKTATASDNAAGSKAQTDLLNAYNVLENLPCLQSRGETREGNLRNGSFTPGVYCANTGSLTGSFVLDGNGDPNAIFIFRSKGGIRAESDFNLTFVNGAESRNVFFVAGTSANIGEGVNFDASIIARDTISVGQGSTVKGRIMSVEGDVKMQEASAMMQDGVLQICKTALGPGLDNRIFRFQIGAQIILVPVGSCSGPITVPAGPTVIDELIDGPTVPTGSFSGRFRLVAVVTDPLDALIDVNLPIRRVTVNIRPGTIQNQTVVEFINTFAVTAIIEICKQPVRDVSITGSPTAPVVTPIATSNSAAALGDANIRDRDLALGTPFEFTVDAIADTVFTVPVGGCSPAILVNVATAPGPVPATAEVFVTELGQTESSVGIGAPINGGLRKCTYRLDGAPESLAASTFPANRFNSIDFNVGVDGANFPVLDTFSNPCGGVVGADVLEGGVANQTTINFWNRSEPGYVKICKVAGPGIPIGTRFAFDVFGRESSNSDRIGTPGGVPTLNPGLAEGLLPGGAGNILPGFDTVRRVVIPAGPAPNGFCDFVSFVDITNLLVRAQYITGSQVLVVEVGANSVVGLPGNTTPNLGPPPVLPNNDPRAAPIDPIPLNNLPFSIPAGSVGGVACTSATTPTNPCPQAQTDPPTGVRVGNIRLNAGVGPQFVSPSTINNLFILPSTVCTTTLGNAANNGLGSATLDPNPSLTCRAAIFRARRGTVEVEFTNFLFSPTLLKVCKAIEGTNIAVGTPFTFSITVANGGLPVIALPNFVVSAGSCVFVQGPYTPTQTVPPVGTFAVGSDVSITELPVQGTTVTSITSPTGTVGACSPLNPRCGRLTLGLGAFNELIFTNRGNPPGEPGGQPRVLTGNSDNACPGVVDDAKVSISLTSLGNEVSANFTVQFDQTKLGNPDVQIGAGALADGFTLEVDYSDVANGRIGIKLTSPTPFTAGVRELITITFDTLVLSAGDALVSFGGATGTLTDAQDNVLPTEPGQASVTIGGPLCTTSTNVTLSGRVMSQEGTGLRNAYVTITDQSGRSRKVTTSSLGFYQIDDIKAGDTYVITASSRRYRFEAKVMQVSDGLSNVDFVGME